MKRILANIFCSFCWLMLACSCGSGTGSKSAIFQANTTASTAVSMVYTANMAPLKSCVINAANGGSMEITEAGTLQGLKLEVPANSLSLSGELALARMDDPPLLEGFVFESEVVVVHSRVLAKKCAANATRAFFGIPATLTLPIFKNTEVGASSKLFHFDETTKTWVENTDYYVDLVESAAVAKISEAGSYVLARIADKPPANLGVPKPGNLLFTLSSPLKNGVYGWWPAHVIFFTGEKPWNCWDKRQATPEVIASGFYNAIEADPDMGIVHYSYYDLPGIRLTGVGKKIPVASYMGAYEPAKFVITQEQVQIAVAFVEAQIGKPYAWGPMIGNIACILGGDAVKGPNSYNCVGLTEKAYEAAKTNNLMDFFQGIVPYDEGELLRPYDQFVRMKISTAASQPPPANNGYSEVAP